MVAFGLRSPHSGLRLAGVLALAASLPSPVRASPGTPPAGYTLTRVSDAIPAAAMGDISQLAFAPGDPSHLFAVRSSANVIVRFDLDPGSGALSNPIDVATALPSPIGLAFRGADLYVSLNAANDSRITRLRDLDHDGLFETRSDFVRGVPNRDHGIDQLQIVGATLFAGIGTKWNGGDPTCEGSVYTGTLARIADLDQIDYGSGANYLASSTEFVNPAPVDGYLRRYAYGFRNPFGLRLDGQGRVFVSDNGASACNTCSSCSNFAIDTPDFFYASVPVGAKGQFPPAGYPGGGGATLAPVATLATHAAVTGFAWIATGPDAGKIALAEFGASSPSIPAGRDLVMVDPATGVVTPMVSGFAGPTDVESDGIGRLWIADYVEPAIYLLTPPGILNVADRGAESPSRGPRIVPNPAREGVTFDYWVPIAGESTLTIFDVSGREVARFRDTARVAGPHQLHWKPTDRLAPGVYVCRIETAAGSASRSFTIVR